MLYDRTVSVRDLSVDMSKNENCFKLMKILVQETSQSTKVMCLHSQIFLVPRLRWLVRTGGYKDKTGFVPRGLEAEIMITTISYLPLK